VREGNLPQSYDTEDPGSAFVRALGDLLGAVDLSKISRCRSCRALFYKHKGQKYCTRACTRQAQRSKPRVQDLRARRAEYWEARRWLEIPLETGDIPSREAYEKTRAAFVAAFPRQRGRAYEEGKEFLTQAQAARHRARWKWIKDLLEDLLADMDAIHGPLGQRRREFQAQDDVQDRRPLPLRTRKQARLARDAALLRKMIAATQRQPILPQPRTEWELLEAGEQELQQGDAALAQAFPDKAGREYEEAKAFLDQARVRVKQFRKRLSGY
jgi:hypothetical protein